MFGLISWIDTELNEYEEIGTDYYLTKETPDLISRMLSAKRKIPSTGDVPHVIVMSELTHQELKDVSTIRGLRFVVNKKISGHYYQIYTKKEWLEFTGEE